VSELTPYPREASEREEAAAAETEAGLRYAGWWRRAGALLIDPLLIAAVAAALLGLGFGLNEVDESAGGILLIWRSSS
jgi:uncharacterized RDD family membrane protein YckC